MSTMQWTCLSLTAREHNKIKIGGTDDADFMQGGIGPFGDGMFRGHGGGGRKHDNKIHTRSGRAARGGSQQYGVGGIQ